LHTLAVSNTSPVWNLASIDRLDLLHCQYPQVLIPDEVFAELEAGKEYPEGARIKSFLMNLYSYNKSL
jgi:predicted nucleic acid-binding protein